MARSDLAAGAYTLIGYKGENDKSDMKYAGTRTGNFLLAWHAVYDHHNVRTGQDVRTIISTMDSFRMLKMVLR
jgi:hypothetical protein